MIDDSWRSETDDVNTDRKGEEVDASGNVSAGLQGKVISFGGKILLRVLILAITKFHTYP